MSEQGSYDEIREMVESDGGEILTDQVNDLANELLQYANYEASVDVTMGGRKDLAQQIDQVTVSVNQTEGLSREIKFDMSKLSDEAAEFFAYCLDNAQARAMNGEED